MGALTTRGGHGPRVGHARAAMLYPDLSRLSIACPTGANNDHEASGSNDPPQYNDPPLPPDDEYDPDWDNLSEEQKEAVIGLLTIEQEERRNNCYPYATSIDKDRWIKGKRNYRKRLSAYLLTNWHKFRWHKIDEVRDKVPWYEGDENNGNICGLEAGQSDQPNEYGEGVYNPRGNWEHPSWKRGGFR